MPGAECSRGRLCLRAGPCLRVRVCLRAGTSDRRAPAVLSLPPLRRRPLPFSKPRAATTSEVPTHPALPGRGIMLRTWAAGITPVLTSALHRFASLGLKSRIAARIALVLTFLLQRLPILGLKSRIDARIAPVLTFWLHRFASLGLKSRIDAVIALVFTSWLHRFASLGLKSRITAVPSFLQVELLACAGVAATVPRPIPIFFVAK